MQFEVQEDALGSNSISIGLGRGGRRRKIYASPLCPFPWTMDDQGSEQRATTRFGLAHPSHQHDRLNTDQRDARHRLSYYSPIANGSYGIRSPDHGLFAFTTTNNKMKSSTQNTDEELLRNDNVNDNVPTPNHPDKHTNTNKNAASKHQPHRSKSRTDIWLERASNMPLVAALLAPLSTLLDIPALTVSLLNGLWLSVHNVVLSF